jgi:hypothetical protein
VTRAVDRFECTPPDTEAVVRRMEELSARADGWINLLPGIRDDGAQVADEQLGLFGFFGFRRPSVTMVTWMPPRPKGRGAQTSTVGIMHARGTRALPALDPAGLTLPLGWTLVQDHPRRGLVARVPADAATPHVVTWCLRAGAALCPLELTGTWLCEVHLPRA